ncbi:ARPP-1 family domain-containing protein [Lignipirellula cremea]|uniref:ARG and Rhodanese-Phosphatase-superfamily-associated domain-containing protein n=1 Tax=Lignipirellula cremea TaxID=2528010 RepID=A0A518DUV0_9BACT|nr:DUF6569 family protein [Lignipirellula cremea]QDU95604.1 hypothetical protein Pla8534_34200 [Lignipirellula cremea]
MSVALPKLRVGDPVRHEALSVFPLFCEVNGGVDYRLSDAALADESLLVEEVSEGGSVPDLLVENKGDVRVLFLEGEELVGARQNRILNTSVLVAAHTKIRIPVSCVEQGRWGYKSRYFGSSGSHSPSKLRRALKASVNRSIKEKRGHTSDQREVWKEVACLHASHGVESSTAAMSDVFDSYAVRIEEYRDKLKYVEGASGVAVAIGNRVVAVDLFDKPVTCQKVWDRLLSGAVFDALEAGKTDQYASVADVELLVATAVKLPWEQSEAVGEGEEYRAESERGDHASALAFEETVVHGSVVAAL